MLDVGLRDLRAPGRARLRAREPGPVGDPLQRQAVRDADRLGDLRAAQRGGPDRGALAARGHRDGDGDDGDVLERRQLLGALEAEDGAGHERQPLGEQRAVGRRERAEPVDDEHALLQRGRQHGVARELGIGEVGARDAGQAAAGGDGDRQRGVGAVHGERRARLRRLPEQPGDLLERVLAPERQRRRRDAAQAPAAGGVVDRGAEQDAGQAVGQHERAVGERRALGRRRQAHGAERAQALVGAERDEHVGDRDAAAREQPGDRARGRGAGGRGGRREAGERRPELRPELAQRDGGEDRRLELVEAEALGGEREARLARRRRRARRRARGRSR